MAERPNLSPEEAGEMSGKLYGEHEFLIKNQEEKTEAHKDAWDKALYTGDDDTETHTAYREARKEKRIADLAVEGNLSLSKKAVDANLDSLREDAKKDAEAAGHEINLDDK